MCNEMYTLTSIVEDTIMYNEMYTLSPAVEDA